MPETHSDVIREKHLPRVGDTVRSKKYKTLWRIIEKKEVWLNASDAMVQAVPVLGMLGAAWTIVGGPYSHLGLAIAWVCLLSMDVCALMFPWDCMLLEACSETPARQRSPR